MRCLLWHCTVGVHLLCTCARVHLVHVPCLPRVTAFQCVYGALTPNPRIYLNQSKCQHFPCTSYHGILYCMLHSKRPRTEALLFPVTLSLTALCQCQLCDSALCCVTQHSRATWQCQLCDSALPDASKLLPQVRPQRQPRRSPTRPRRQPPSQPITTRSPASPR